jgi:MoxR-like ATPase
MTFDEAHAVAQRLQTSVESVIRGQSSAIRSILACMASGGHVLLEDVPGTGKTTLAKALANAIHGATFKRVQFTPDLLPSDILGLSIFDPSTSHFRFQAGPVFTDILLADEINRATPKTQSAMLETMQEGTVTVAGKRYELKKPFFVLATQNPVEQEGTYPLPEAQLDRFMFLIEVDYPSEEEEVMIARTTTGDTLPPLDHVLSAAEIIEFQHLVRRVPVPDHIYQFATRLVRRTRPQGATAPDWLKPLVAWGAGPRAVQYLILGAKARAALTGGYMVRLEDIAAVAAPVLTHRVLTTFAAQAEGIDARRICERLVSEALATQSG